MDLLDRLLDDFNQIEDIATLEMPIYLANLALERARLAANWPLDFDEATEMEARKQSELASKLIKKTNYRRRKSKLAMLQRKIDLRASTK